MAKIVPIIFLLAFSFSQPASSMTLSEFCNKILSHFGRGTRSEPQPEPSFQESLAKFENGENLDLSNPSDARAFQYLKKMFEDERQEQSLIWLYRASGQVDLAYKIAEELRADLQNGQFVKVEPLRQIGQDQKNFEGNSGNVFMVTFKSGRKGIFRWNKSNRRDFKHEYEVATSIIDEDIGLDIVPITVEREIEGHLGALQIFISSSGTATKRGRLEPGGSIFSWPDPSGRIQLLDLLIANRDRNPGNQMFLNGTQYQFAIDHTTLTFEWDRVEIEYEYARFRTTPLEFDPGPRIRGRLASLDLKNLRLKLQRWLSQDQIDSLIDAISMVTQTLSAQK